MQDTFIEKQNTSFINKQSTSLNNDLAFIDGKLHNQQINPAVIAQAKQALNTQGWILLRGFKHSTAIFSELFSQFCHQLTFDPARDFSDSKSQMVDAGTAPVGLHIENGNTPFPPDVVAFYSQKSALSGSQTTICDGEKIFDAMSPELKTLFNEDMRVERTIPELLWKRYVAHEHPQLERPEQVTEEHVKQMMAQMPGQTAKITPQGDLFCQLTFSPLLENEGQLAFANAILGPSFNYQKPRYFFKDGTELTETIKAELAEIAEAFTIEQHWQDGDMVLIDNKRVMHGRRAIEGALADRKLVIAMGMCQ